jgi:HlyD family secretion protein
MDIARPEFARRRRARRVAYASLATAVVVLVTAGVSRLQPAAPSVERATVWLDTVKRGPMLRQVRGPGTLVPEDIRWIPATTQGRVERILLRPGTRVTPGSVILELSNPQLEQELQDAALQLQSAEASLANLRVQVQNAVLNQRAAVATIDAELSRARMQLEMDEALATKGLVSALQVRRSRLDVGQLAVRHELAQEQLASQAESSRAQLLVQQSSVDQARALVALRRRQRDELRVRAGLDGVLQVVPVEVGAQVNPGTNLARVANPSRLKAEIRIAETQAKDIQVGQRAEIDTRNGIVPGSVQRIDPSVLNGTRTVDIALDGDLPKGAVPDLSVDGAIILERLEDVLSLGRPAVGQEGSVVTLFRQDSDGAHASRVQVRLGRSSVSQVEVVEGLSVGDTVVLSDMSAWDRFDRIRLQ